MPMGKDGTLGDGMAVDKLSVGSDKGVSVETTPACCGRHADNERARRQTDIKTCLKNNLDCIGYLCYIVIYRLFIVAKRLKQFTGGVFNFYVRAGARRSRDSINDGDGLYKVPNKYIRDSTFHLEFKNRQRQSNGRSLPARLNRFQPGRHVIPMPDAGSGSV
jgi:hypothetical protein